MYGAGIIFLAYCYLFKVYPTWFNSLIKFAAKHRWINEVSVCFIINNIKFKIKNFYFLELVYCKNESYR